MKEKVSLYRRNGKNIYIKQPEFEELSFVEKLWGDEETMSEIGGAYLFPKERWEMFYKKMVQPTDGKNFYCLIYTIRDKAIGEVSFHGYDSITKVARINVKIHHRYRNKGYGKEAIKLLLEYYFMEFSGEAIIDNIKNEGAKKLFSSIGFEEFGKFRNQLTYKITKNQFLNSVPRKNRSVAVIAYEDMDIIEYNIPFEIFNKANKLAGEELFNVYGVGVSKLVTSGDNITVKLERSFEDDFKPEIIIIPGGNGAQIAAKDKFLIKYILSNYNNSDYLVSLSTALYILNRCRMLDGISIPEVREFKENLEESSLETRFTNKNFEDNGKVVIAANILGGVKGCLNIVKKLAGDKVEKELSNEIGRGF
ncbi:hypothetical protein JCM1393_21940 [Clostridium carnis]